VRLLLNNGANADAKDEKGLTSMMYAVLFGRIPVIQALRVNRSARPPASPGAGN
jgi:ankyrin repeat protein